jgi:RNA polymerase sigma factor (sigma-70 family)
MSLTVAQIRSAQTNDLAGITAVLAEMEERVSRLAAQAARRIDGNLREDFEQDAREALFLALPRYDLDKVSGDPVDGFLGFLYTTIAEVLKDRVREQRYVGVDKDAVKTFMSVLGDAEGDPYKAAKLATALPKGERLSADRADAARLAWQGAVSIDKGNDDENEGASLADTLAVVDETPKVQPKVGHGAALEALAVLQRYSSARSVLSALPVKPEDVDAIEDTLTVPRDETVRRYVLDSIAILRSYVSTATDGDLAEELRDVSDERRDERAAKIGMVRAALDKMGEGQRTVLKHTFGIDGAVFFGHGDGCDNDGLAELLGLQVNAVRVSRTKAFKSFTKYYIALAAGSEAEAITLNEAAASNLSRGGRK